MSGRPRGPMPPRTFVSAVTLNHANHTSIVSPIVAAMHPRPGSPCSRWVRRSMATTKTRSQNSSNDPTRWCRTVVSPIACDMHPA